MGTNYGVYGIGPDEYTIWELRFCWWPQRCSLSNRRIWLKCAYRGMRVITGPGDPLFIYWWHDTKEHFIWKLKGI